MSGDPAAVGHAAVHVALAKVEAGLGGQRGVEQVARGAVRDALGLAGRARGVQDEERVLAVHLRRAAVGPRPCHQLPHPEVAARSHGHVGPGALEDEDPAHLHALQSDVHHLLELDRLPAPATLVGGEHDWAGESRIGASRRDSHLLRQSRILFLSDSAEKPAKTTECTAPILAQASITIASSGTMGMYTVTTSPLRMPASSITLAMRQTSRSSSA